MRLFNPDCYAIITANGEQIDLSAVSASTQRRLDVSFNCFLTKDSEPNEGECTYYNLSEATRNKIVKDARIEFYAGYDGEFKLVSVGDITTVKSRKPNTDWSTTIKWGDGVKKYTDVNFRKSYTEGIQLKDILSDLISSLGLSSQGVIEELSQKINGGLSVNGKTKDILNKITKDYGLEWSIQDEIVSLVQKSKPIDDDLIFISQSTGQLEFPQVSEKGVDFITQLNNDIRPNKLVDIQSSNSFELRVKDEKIASSANGIRIVETVRFIGNNFGGDFVAMANCRAYNG